MKKLFFLLFAALCLCCCVKDEQEVVYTISLGPSSLSVAGPIPSAGRDILEEFYGSLTAFTNKNKADFVWVETVVNDDYSKQDAAAKAKFNSYLDELQTIAAEYQTKFDACEDDMTIIDVTYALQLERTGNKSALLAKETISVSLSE